MASDVEGLFGAVPGKVWARDICDSETRQGVWTRDG